MVYRSLASLPYRSLYSLVSHAQSCINTAFLSNGHHCSELCSSTRFFKQAKAAAHKKGSAYSTIKKPRTFYTLRDAALAIIIIGVLIFPIATRFLSVQVVPYFVVAFILTQIAAGALLAIALLKTSRTLGLIFLVILAFSAVVGFLASRLTG
jgi:hypothetical protein